MSDSDYEYDITPMSEGWDLSGANADQMATAEQLQGLTGIGWTGTSLSDILMGDQAEGYLGRWIDPSGQLHDTRQPGEKSWFDSLMGGFFDYAAPIVMAAGAGAASGGLGAGAMAPVFGGLGAGVASGTMSGDSGLEIAGKGAAGAAAGAIASYGTDALGEALSAGQASPGFEEAWMNANPTVFSGESAAPAYESLFSSGLEHTVDPTLMLAESMSPLGSYGLSGVGPTDAMERIAQGYDSYDEIASQFSPEGTYESGHYLGDALGLTNSSGNFFEVNPDLANFNDLITANQLSDDFGKDLTFNSDVKSSFNLPSLDDTLSGLSAANALYKLLVGGETEVPGGDLGSSWANAVGDMMGKASGAGGSEGGGIPSGSFGLGSDLAKRSKGLFTNPISDEIARFGGQLYYS